MAAFDSELTDRFCCFFCPQAGHEVHALRDVCATCGKTYAFPLEQVPSAVREYQNLLPLSRGFYSAVYIAERGALRTKSVLKIAPKAIYDVFPHKNFEEECRTHDRVAADSEHIVPIRDYFEADVAFGTAVLPCWVAVLDYVDGPLLENVISRQEKIKGVTAAQIAIDLFRILKELDNKGVAHNDLHARNLVVHELKEGAKRAEAVDESIRVIALDLGSVAGETRSNAKRLNDVHWVARHLHGLVESLLNEPERSVDLDFRLAAALQERAFSLSPDVLKSRAPSWDECIDDVWQATRRVSKPWQERLKLHHFGDSYNALTLAPWFVPLLLVDTGERWRSRISTPGPQLITGMRGCGKTMLLRAVQFHARAAERKNEQPADAIARVRDDGFLGLYVSALRLLENPVVGEAPVEPFARLYVAYALEAVRTIFHLLDLEERASGGETYVDRRFHRILGEAVDAFLGDAGLSTVSSGFELERQLIRLSAQLTKPENDVRLSGVPAAAFIHLAGAVQKCSTIWANARVLFLLDDVSTRFLKEQRIRDLLSALLFSDPVCSFKVTTEAQTFLQSPAIIEAARPGRDYDTFDLGADVYQRLRDNGKSFLEEILYHRAQFYAHHPQSLPSRIVGDVALETIARTIAAAPKTSGTRKEVYHGMSALAALCVGDIGDVINLYERMLARHSSAADAVPPRIQSEAYQDFCNRHLYHLNRRGNEFKDFALTFAAASHELLLKSVREIADGTETRLRQYMKLYVRVTTGDLQWQLDKLRELIDSGVFILAGGSDTPRMKTKDADPVHQFVLTYRKLLGLSNFIGLAERDRFELSGGQLEEWLAHPARGEEILMRNLGGPEPESEQPPVEEPPPPPGQIDLFADNARVGAPRTRRRRAARQPTSREKSPALAVPKVREVPLKELRSLHVSHALFGLGFEERTAKSAARWLKHARPGATTLIDYSESSPRRVAILETAQKYSATVEVMPYADVANYRRGNDAGCPLVDVTGLAKPALFHGIRQALLSHRRVLIMHTRAEQYYPRDSDIDEILRAHKKRDPSLLDELQRVLTGETGPYKVINLLESDADASRRRILFAFASAKHQRLLTLLENRDYDAVEIVAPASSSPRSKIAALAADVATGMVQEGHVVKIDSSDLPRNLDFLAARYSEFYIRQGFNVEFGLTGSKLQGVAAAALTTTAKIANAWYIGPSAFDPKRFTEGVGETRCYLIEVPALAV